MGTVLLPGATLKDKNFDQAIQRARDLAKNPLPKKLAQFEADAPLSSIDVADLGKKLQQLCDTDPRRLLTMAKLKKDDEATLTSDDQLYLVRLSHFMILLANELHQKQSSVGRFEVMVMSMSTAAVVVAVAIVLMLLGLRRDRDVKPNTTGAVYVRWGKRSCTNGFGTETIYSGVAGGGWYDHKGAATNYQCLPTNPQWGRYYQDGVQGQKAYMFGAEYELDSNVPFGDKTLHNHDVQCAVCYVPTRGSKVMIPARITCPEGWSPEYDGYLMAERHDHVSAKEFVCVDGHPDAVPGRQANQDGATLYPVEARCGSLPCDPSYSYVEGRELTCVVCTK